MSVSRFFMVCSLPDADDRTAALRSTVTQCKRGILAPDQQKRPGEPGRLMSRQNL